MLMFLKRNLHKFSYLMFVFAMILVATFCFATQNSKASQTDIKIGVFLNGFDGNLKQAMLHYEGACSFILYDDETTLLDDVKSLKLECGYIINHDYVERMLQNRSKNIVKVYTNKNTTLSGISNEVVFSLLYQEYVARYLDEYITENSELSGDELTSVLALAKNTFYDYTTNGTTFNFDYITLSDGNKNTDSVISYPFVGLISVFLLIIALSGGYQLKVDNENRIYSKISAYRKNFYYAKYLFIYNLPFHLAGFVCMVILSGMPIVSLAVKSLLYIPILIFITLLFMMLLKNTHLYLSMLPFAILSCIILTPAVIDLSLFIPVLNKVFKLFPPYYLQQKSSLTEAAAYLFIVFILYFVMRIVTRKRPN